LLIGLRWVELEIETRLL
jgi:hypothetical protein